MALPFYFLCLLAVSNIFQSMLNECVQTLPGSDALTHMMPSVPRGNYCENLRKFVGGSGGEVTQIKDDSDKCSFSGKERQKQLSTDK